MEKPTKSKLEIYTQSFNSAHLLTILLSTLHTIFIREMCPLLGGFQVSVRCECLFLLVDYCTKVEIVIRYSSYHLLIPVLSQCLVRLVMIRFVLCSITDSYLINFLPGRSEFLLQLEHPRPVVTSTYCDLPPRISALTQA